MAGPFDGVTHTGTRKGREAPRTHEPGDLSEALAMAYTERMAEAQTTKASDPARAAMAEHLRESADSVAEAERAILRTPNNRTRFDGGAAA